jgi:hypothetical protein
MNKILLCVFFWAAATPITLMAQERGEISLFGGYSRLYALWSDAQQGWNVSLAGNVAKNVALVGDVSGLYSSANYAYSGYTFNGRTILAAYNEESRCGYHTFMFGPRLVVTIKNRFTPFVHFLAGEERYSLRQHHVSDSIVQDISSSHNYFAVSIGIGADIKINNRVSIRPIQLDAIGPRQSGHWDLQGRTSFGAVFRLDKLSN